MQVYFNTVIFFIFCWTNALFGQPMVKGVFGGENCPWSKQLQEEVWNSSTFQAILTTAGIGIKEEKTVEKEMPVLILVDSKGDEIGRLGFLMIPPEKYASLFKEMVSIYELSQNLGELNVNQLLIFYRKCQVLNMQRCEAKILERGLAIDTGTDFLIESYAKLCKDHPRKAQKLKSEIRKRKPNSPAIEWQLALLSFQAKNENGAAPKEAAKPLEKYLQHYGDLDQDSRWRCHLVLAEFFREKNLVDRARHHAELAVKDAPDDMKEMILHD
jgi:hypothetical protein